MSAYIIGRVTISDPDTYKKYAAQTPALIEKHGGRFLVRGGDVDALECEAFDDRVVVIEFPSKQALHDWYNDPDYQAVKELRHVASEGELFAVEGV